MWTSCKEGSVCRGGKKPGFRVLLGLWCRSVAAGGDNLGCATCATRAARWLVGCRQSHGPTPDPEICGDPNFFLLPFACT
eukprot:g67631.t1